MRVALELQPCCGKRSGIGTYAWEIAHRLRDGDGLTFSGNLFNFLGRNDNSASLRGISIPICENPLLPYGVYRRLWHAAPVSYSTLFPGADLSVFFNFIVPPRIEGHVMTTVHDLTYLRYPETMDARNLRRITHDIGYSLKRSDRILTISEFSKGKITELLHIPPEQISVVCAAPSELPEGADFSAVAEKYGIKKPYLLYIGTIEPRKNLVRLIQAFDRAKTAVGLPHQLVLAGGNGWNNTEIYESARAARHSGDVLFPGYISAAEKTVLYQNADAFTFPSLYEGFGIPPLEAMSQSCPVLCADAASLPEVVGDAALLVDPLDTNAIATGLEHLATDESLRRSLIQKGAERCQRFTWQKSAERLTTVCREVLNCPCDSMH